MTKNIAIIFGVIVVIAGGVAVWMVRDFLLYRHTVTIGDTVVRVRVARSPWQHQHGLGGTAHLCDTCGMLLHFGYKDIRTLWMRGMVVDIDAIWIADGRVTDVAQDMQWRRGTADIRVSQQPADTIVEVPAGFVAAHGIRVGDRVTSGDIE